MRESDIETRLMTRARSAGGYCRKVRWIGRRGAPDRCVIINGHTVWVELKRPGGQPEPHQLREHARMRAAGARVEVIDSFEKIEALINEMA